MARASRKTRTSGRASVVGPSGSTPLPRTNYGFGRVVPRTTAVARPVPVFRRLSLVSRARGVRDVVNPMRVVRRNLRRAVREAVGDPAKGLRFVSPRRVLVCVKRKIRREVLFAFAQAGFSGSGRGRWRGLRRSYRRTAESRYGC